MLIAVLIGIFVGFCSGFLGVGGGTILVPILVFLGFPFKTAVGISVTQMMLSSLFGSYLNYKKGVLKIGEGIALGIGGAVGGLMSGWITALLPSPVLVVIFLTLVVIAILRFWFQIPEGEESRQLPQWLLFLIGAGVGAVAISVGVGGAILITPILTGFLKYPLKKSVSLSLMFVVFSSISGFISHMVVGSIDYEKGFIIGLASLIGTYLGVKLYHWIHPTHHKKVLLVWYIAVLFAMGYKLITGAV